MTLELTSTVTLSNGVEMPVLGFGTYKAAEGPEVEYAVRTALEVGYRHVDTASMYENEEGVGRALHRSGVAREEVFVATKVWNDEQGEEHTLAALEGSLRRLGLDHIDLYLVHWPLPHLMASTWRGMERALDSGKARAIGVCNFLQPALDQLAAVAEVGPMVDQIEHHPRLVQSGLRAALRERGIVLEAWAPVMRGAVCEIAELVEIGDRHGKTAAQVALRWVLQCGGVAIPKSVTAARIQENADIFDFELSPAEIATIDALDLGEEGRIGKHPDVFVRPWTDGRS